MTNRNTLTEWDLYTLTMRYEADAIAERFSTKQLQTTGTRATGTHQA